MPQPPLGESAAHATPPSFRSSSTRRTVQQSEHSPQERSLWLDCAVAAGVPILVTPLASGSLRASLALWTPLASGSLRASLAFQPFTNEMPSSTAVSSTPAWITPETVVRNFWRAGAAGPIALYSSASTTTANSTQ